MEIQWTRHAEDRQKEWEKKVEITRAEVESLVENPEQIVPGDRSAKIAQAKRGLGLLRAPFLEMEGNRKILTVYWTSKVEKYWKEEQDEDTV